MSKLLVPVLPLTALVLAGCASGSYSPPEPQAASHASVVVDAPFDETWSRLVRHTSSQWFGIEHVEKASGLITIDFTSDNPSRYVDCGHFDNGSYNGGWSAFVGMHGGTLQGRANVLAQEATPGETEVTVTTRYSFTVLGKYYVYPTGWIPYEDHFVFNTGGSDTVLIKDAIAGTDPARTCQPTGAFEQEVLSVFR